MLTCKRRQSSFHLVNILIGLFYTLELIPKVQFVSFTHGCSSVAGSRALLSDTRAEARNTSLRVSWSKSERVRRTAVAVRSDDGRLALALLSMRCGWSNGSWTALLDLALDWHTGSEVWPVTTALVAWSTVFARRSDVSWWADTLLDFKS